MPLEYKSRPSARKTVLGGGIPLNEIGHLADQHRRALEGRSWHGPAILDALKGVTAAGAAARPLADVHSIWEIVRHIEAWDRVALRRIRGETVSLTDEEDWPSIEEPGRAAWRRDVESMKATHRELNRAIAKLTTARLDRKPGPTSRIKLFHLVYGIIEHEIYHAGQIAILRKA